MTFPTASKMGRLALCPGAWNATKDLPPSESGPEAQRGTRVHEGLANLAMGQATGLAGAEHDCAVQLWELFKSVYSQLGFGEDTKENNWSFEERLSLGKFSGQYDVAVRRGSIALLADYKTGWVPITTADANYQIRALSVLFKKRYPEIKQLFGAIIQLGNVTVTNYSETDLQQAEWQLERILKRVISPDAERIAGDEQCAYCPAKQTCPECQSYSTSKFPAEIRADLPARVWTTEDWRTFLEWRGTAKKWIESKEAEAKGMLEQSPTCLPGYRLKKVQRRTVIDVLKVWASLSKIAVTGAEFGAKCRISLEGIEEILRAKGYSGKQLLQIKNDAIDGAVELSETTSIEKK